MIPLLRTEDREIAKRWRTSCIESDKKEDEWIEQLREQGVKAAHPDDGWVDRRENSVFFSYPQFYDGVSVGDKIALGWPTGKTRIVKVTGTKKGIISGMIRYLFV